MSQTQTSVPVTDERWISCKEMAARKGTTPRTLQRLAKAGRIQHHKIPGTSIIRFSPEDVAAFDREAQQPAAV